MVRTALLLLLMSASRSAAQLPFALRAREADVTIIKDVLYATSDTVRLAMDVYTPVGPGGSAPVLVFFNRATGEDRSNPFYAAWASVAASRGVVAVLPDLRAGREAQDFDALLTFMGQHGHDLGMDTAAIAVYAGSGNVAAAFPLVEAPARTAVKAAVMYYGTADVTRYRLDLPVLFVRAGLDRPPVNERITAMAAQAVSQNAPLQLLNHATGYHGFETANDDDATRAVMESTLDFVKRATAPAIQAAIREGLLEATAAGLLTTGEAAEAARIYGQLVARRPDDPRLALAYGEALLGAARYEAACALFETLKGKGLGYRDLGLPAARACMLKGDADAAIEWLRSIPGRFLPPGIRDEPAFAPLRNRPEFLALFRRSP